MTRRHARPMSAHQRAQRSRGAEYARFVVELAVFIAGVVAILGWVVLAYGASAPSPV